MRHEFTLSTIVEVDDAEIYIVETVRNNYEPYSLRVKEVNLENRIVFEEDLSWRVLRKEKKQRIDEEKFRSLAIGKKAVTAKRL